jgi:cell division protein FtsZ
MEDDFSSRFSFDDAANEEAKICVLGVGGGGGNAINNMVEKGIHGSVEFIAVNTDAQALNENKAPQKIQAGKNLTKGLGAGARPSVGAEAIEENADEIRQALEGFDMVFITAGMGGGTGTGGAPVVASIARSMDILTVAIVTRPFECEGARRIKTAHEGIELLRENVDTLIVIPNERLLDIADDDTSLIEAFEKADEVLYNATRGISDLITVHGLINLDFADVQTTMKNGGTALMGSANATGENRAEKAAIQAISSPLLDGLSIAGARNVLVNITSGPSLGIREATTATSVIQKEAGDDVEVIFGTVIDEEMEDRLRVTVIATGFDRDRDDDEAAGGQGQTQGQQQGQPQGQPQQGASQQAEQAQGSSGSSNGSSSDDDGMRRTVPLDDSEGSPVYKYKGEDNLRHLDTPAYERRTSPLRSKRNRPPKSDDGDASGSGQGASGQGSGQGTASGQQTNEPESGQSSGSSERQSNGEQSSGEGDEPVIRRLRADDVDRQKPSRGDRSSSGSDSSGGSDTDDDTPAFLRKMMD